MTISDAALEAAIDLIEVPTTLLDLEGRIRHVNPANARLLGRTAEELCGKPVGTVFPAGMFGDTGALLATLLEHGKLDGIVEYLRRDETTVPIEVSAVLVRSADGTPCRILATARDLGPELDQLAKLNASALRLLDASGDDLLVTIVRVARELLGARYAALGLVEDGRLVRFIPDGMSDSRIAEIEHWPMGHGLLGAMITERRTMRLDEISTDPRSSGFPPGHPPMRSFLGTPILTADALYGHLYFTDKRDVPGFSVVDEGLAELFASHAAIAIRDQHRREALEESSRLLGEAQEIGGTGSGEWDLASDQMRWSDEALRLFGVDPGRITHLADFLAVVAPDDRSKVETGLRATLDSGRPFRLRHRLVRADGQVRVFSSHAEVVRDADGAPVRMIGTVQDVTEQVAAEEEQARLEEGLRQSERHLAEAQRIAHVGSWERDLATGVLHWSDESHRMFGIEPGTFAGTLEAYLAFVHPDDRGKAAPSLADLHAGYPGTADYRIVRADGAVRFLHEEAEVIRDATGSPVRFVGSTQDITERVAAAEERVRLTSAVEQTADSVMITSLDGTIVWVNPSFARLYRYRSEDVVGLHARILRSDRHDDSFYAARMILIEAGETWTGSIVHRRGDGTFLEAESVVSPIRDPDGRVTGYVQADRDVTRERELEGALVRRARERQTIEAALERIDSGATPEEIAVVACAQVIGLPNVDSAFVTALDQGQGQVLAVAGRLTASFAAGRVIPGARAQYLLERAAGGIWTEEWQARPEDGSYGEQVDATGSHTVAYAPIRGPDHGVIGVVGFGTHDKAPDELMEQQPLMTTLASILGTLLCVGLEARHREDAARASIRGIIDASHFSAFFQPIVDLHTGAVVGYEALSRFTDGTAPDVIFASAARVGLEVELEMTTLGAALQSAGGLPAGAFLSLNVSPALIGSGRLATVFAGQTRSFVLEITEHDVIDDYAELRRALDELGPSVRLAVDDAGAGYASLRHVLELRPDFVKLDVGLIRGIDGDPARQALIAGMSYFAVKRKVLLVAEGIETVAERDTIRSLAVTFGQGYALGPPQDIRLPAPWPTRIDVGVE